MERLFSYKIFEVIQFGMFHLTRNVVFSSTCQKYFLKNIYIPLHKYIPTLNRQILNIYRRFNIKFRSDIKSSLLFRYFLQLVFVTLLVLKVEASIVSELFFRIHLSVIIPISIVDLINSLASISIQ